MNYVTTGLFMDFYKKFKDESEQTILNYCNGDSNLASNLTKLIKMNKDEDSTISSTEYTTILEKLTKSGYACLVD